jgi:hypothetical protein
MAPALTSAAPTAPHELSKKLANNNAPKNIFPDGIKTSGQHDPLYDQLRPYSDFPKEITGVCIYFNQLLWIAPLTHTKVHSMEP